MHDRLIEEITSIIKEKLGYLEIYNYGFEEGDGSAHILMASPLEMEKIEDLTEELEYLFSYNETEIRERIYALEISFDIGITDPVRFGYEEPELYDDPDMVDLEVRDIDHDIHIEIRPRFDATPDMIKDFTLKFINLMRDGVRSRVTNPHIGEGIAILL